MRNPSNLMYRTFLSKVLRRCNVLQIDRTPSSTETPFPTTHPDPYFPFFLPFLVSSQNRTQGIFGLGPVPDSWSRNKSSCPPFLLTLGPPVSPVRCPRVTVGVPCGELDVTPLKDGTYSGILSSSLLLPQTPEERRGRWWVNVLQWGYSSGNGREKPS